MYDIFENADMKIFDKSFENFCRQIVDKIDFINLSGHH